MFGGGFNEIAFNTGGGENIIDMSAHLSGGAQMYTKRDADEYELEYAMEMSLSSDMSGESQLQADFVREIVLEAVPMSGEARISGEYVREINMRSELSGEARLIAAASRYHVDYIEFEDVFNPGDQIIIDTDKFKILRNGQNVSHLYNGDFFYLNLGENNLTWTDPETGRTVLMRITHRDKFLY
ncbi:phage distal tail protein [Paenibacillus xylanexedens]|uniref:phage distal tail protein n=1 Tax=Paenibacillus xylanexedens TaxID=528191 RepID=UPI0011A5B5CA|nr:phage tail domain-containing protein [Paenibacillus xylanexedens]